MRPRVVSPELPAGQIRSLLLDRLLRLAGSALRCLLLRDGAHRRLFLRHSAHGCLLLGDDALGCLLLRALWQSRWLRCGCILNSGGRFCCALPDKPQQRGKGAYAGETAQS